MVLVDGTVVVCLVATGEEAGVGEDLLGNQECLVGLGETGAGVGDVATVVAGAVSFFLCLRLATLAEGSGLAEGAGDVATVVAGAVSFFLCLRLATLAEGDALAEGGGD